MEPSETENTPNATTTYDEQKREADTLARYLETEWDGAASTLRPRAVREPDDLRRELYATMWRSGVALDDVTRRQGIVDVMVGEVAREEWLQSQLLKWLQDFRSADFSEGAKRQLAALPWTPDYAPEVIRVIGVAEIEAVRPRLEKEAEQLPEQAEEEPMYATNAWAARLALARMGDQARLRQVMAAVEDTSDDVIRATVLLQDVGYTKQPAAYSLIRDYLLSDARLPSVKESDPGRLEACYAAAVLSEHIVNCPIRETDFTEEQVMQLRPWAKQQESWQIIK